MPKRRASDESDAEEQVVESSSSKRPRVNGAGDDTQDRPSTAPSIRGKKQQKRGDDDDDDVMEDVDDEGDESSDERFEAEYGDAVRASIESKSKVQGRVAQHGIIQSLEMHQFMCHKRLSFQFGPQVNFIIGHNGSGKSAVLSAITVALGGKATSTGRGSGLKSFIREGQAGSEVTITIKNEGEESYKPDIYGKSITITRRFSKEGSSSYLIKGKDGKIVSRKREELSAICDHMNIQVDNPMNVLTQDAARQFLSASQPGEKYKFFLRGTQLSQLSAEYETCLENIGKTAKVLEIKKDALPDLKKQVKEANARYSEAHKALAQKSKVDELKKELAWAHVKTKEDEMRGKVEEVAKATRRLPKIEDSFKTAEASFKSSSDNVIILEGKLSELGDIDHLEGQKKNLQDKIKANRNKLQDIINNERNMNAEIEKNKQTITEYEARIAEETAKLQEDAQAKREERERKLQAAKKDVDDHEARLKAINDQLREKQAEREAITGDGNAADDDVKKAQDLIRQCASQIDRCKEQMKNKLVPFGKCMDTVLKRIKESRWQGQLPVGPLGIHVSLRDPKWATVMRTQLGAVMQSFAITDPKDRPQLKKILNDAGNQQVNIIVSEVDMFDYSHGEPAPGMLTVLRALKISDEYVLRILINQARIERTLLGETRKDGQDAVNSLTQGGVAWTSDGYRVQNYGDGGSNSQRLGRIDNGDPRMLMFTHGDPASQKSHWEQEGRAADAQYVAAKARVEECRRLFADNRLVTQKLDQQARLLTTQIRDFKQVYHTVVGEHNEDVPVSISALEEARDETERNKTSIMDQFRDLMERKKQISSEQKPLMHDKEKVQLQITAFEEQVKRIKDQIMEAIEGRMKAQSDKNHYEKKLHEERDKVNGLNEAAKTLQSEYEEWTAKAEGYCARVENTRHPDEVIRLLKSVQKALADREREQGATVQELQLEVINAKEKYDAAEKDLKDMTNLNKVLKSSLVVRLARWNDFRRHIALRTKLQFQYHLANRGYFGKVLFDHTAETLQLKVQTDDQASTQNRDKDPRSLSGGEKSFSTICLLLSLWEAIGCPIRCLDEFDVFMDAVNRRISMKMMIDTANSSDSKQYILITPQDMSTVALGPTVRVNRMGDPERGQNTLAFAS